MKKTLFKSIKGFSILLCVGIWLFVFSCAPINQITGKSVLESQLAEVKKQNELLLENQHKLETEIKDREQSIAELKDTVTKLQESKEKGIRVSLFRGEIIYNILSEAYNNYKIGLRYMSLNNPSFGTNLEKFQRGMGGDKDILNVLIGIDQSGDQIIDKKEAKAFRHETEQNFSREKLDAPEQ